MRVRKIVVAAIIVAAHFAAAQKQAKQSPIVFYFVDSLVDSVFPQGEGSGPPIQQTRLSSNGSVVRGCASRAKFFLHARRIAPDPRARRRWLALFGRHALAFAQSAEKSRDWAAYWEIDGERQALLGGIISLRRRFLVYLPANFDVLDAAVRMWRCTGDDGYRSNPAFQRFRYYDDGLS